ncbi:MAG: hypothetical protein H0W72_15155 [Planctomycetes bacterium]|nr:hypothetical protein [Planctomycetota bacterium]
MATKSDLGQSDARATVAVSVVDGNGLDALAGLVAAQLSCAVASEPRQARLLGEADAVLTALIRELPSDELLAEDLRRASTILGDLLGETTADEVLDGIFARFCIGK